MKTADELLSIRWIEIIFWVLLLYFIGYLMGCASNPSRCAYPNQHSWCAEKSVCNDETDSLKKAYCQIGEVVERQKFDKK